MKLAVALLTLLLFVTPSMADDGIITKSSNYSVKDTISRFAAAIKSREGAGFIVFTEIDHAAAGKKFGIEMRPRTVVIFGNPKLGTPVMTKTPLLAIDNPPKALVWEDDQGKVWLSYNSADYLYKTIYPRHGLETPSNYAPFAKILNDVTDEATK
jgi:uncharacterized protein (DUF302 family)